MASYPTRQTISPRSLAFRKCISEKVGFQSAAHAIEAAELLMMMGKVEPGCHLTPYVCRDCNEWHLFNRKIWFPKD